MNKYDYNYGPQDTPPVLMPGEQVLWQGKPKKNAFILNKVLNYAADRTDLAGF